MSRRDYGTGSVYQRRSDWRWMGSIEGGWTAEGTRRRIPVSCKGCVGGCAPRCPHRAEIKRRIRDKARQIEADGLPAANARTTVKAWAETWLAIKAKTLRPKGYNAAASPIRVWIVPTIGHRRLDLLTPGDVRAVEKAQRDAGRSGATANGTHRTLMNMLGDAVAEGHAVPQRIFHTKAPRPGVSDRTAMELDEALACIAVAGQMPHGVRWLLACWYGARQGECLGLVRDTVEPDRIRLEWQLQALPYNVPRNRASGFRLPDELEVRHLVDAWHLTRPKSSKGVRVLPTHEAITEAMDGWLTVAPENPWGLVFPTAEGRPMNDKTDRAEWWEIQRLAGVAHPSGRPYYVHECRNFAATMLDEEGASENVITSMLGHASIVTSRGYMTVHEGPKRAAIEAVGRRLLG